MICCMSNKDNNMGVIFDLDGVLVDTGWAHKQSWLDLGKEEGFSMSDEFFCSTFGMQNYMIIPMVTGRDLPREEIDRMADGRLEGTEISRDCRRASGAGGRG